MGLRRPHAHDPTARWDDAGPAGEIAIILSWSESDDASIHTQFDRFKADYEVLPLKWLHRPLRAFFFALSPDSAMSGDDFLDALAGASFSEAFLLRDGRAFTRLQRLESIEEAQLNHQRQGEALLRQFLPQAEG